MKSFSRVQKRLKIRQPDIIKKKRKAREMSKEKRMRIWLQII